jgi:hypothetical protein
MKQSADPSKIINPPSIPYRNTAFGYDEDEKGVLVR